MTGLNKDAGRTLSLAKSALERATQAANQGGAPNVISPADKDIEAAAMSEIDLALKLIERARR